MLGAGAGIDDGFPGVVFRAKPPDLPAAPGGDLGVEQGAVQGGMPLGRQPRKACRKVVLPRLYPPPRAVGAARTPDPGADHGFVVVASLTAPPDPLVAAVGDSLRGQGRVACRVPLGEQCLSMVFRAEIK